MSVLVTFGKWKDCSLADVADLDPQYIRWIVSQPFAMGRPKLYREARAILMKQLQAEIDAEFHREVVRLGCADLV